MDGSLRPNELRAKLEVSRSAQRKSPDEVDIPRPLAIERLREMKPQAIEYCIHRVGS